MPYIIQDNKISPAELTAALTDCVVDAIQNVKGGGISIVTLDGIDSAPASRFVICQGKSTTQVSAISDSIRDAVLRDLHIKPYHIDGYRNSQWIVLDYGNIIVHVFLPDIRQLYNLEDLWNDADIREIPDLD